jgi:hypothetical protein
MLDGASWAATIGGVVAGALLIGLAIPRGRIRHQYDGWDRYLAW